MGSESSESNYSRRRMGSESSESQDDFEEKPCIEKRNELCDIQKSSNPSWCRLNV